ncbi:MAG: AMP-binding protein, partial [Firmicutes bacterium]|nr:AMP-binding protein [Bacillota bacterium]
MAEQQWFEPSPETVAQANITRYMQEQGFENYQDLWRWSVDNKEAFWADMARGLHWFRPWDRVLEGQPPRVKWFAGGQTNICFNALDRHVLGAGRDGGAAGSPQDKTAFHWEGEPGDRRTITYQDLYRDVNLLAASLQEMGIGSGDRVVLYLPRVPEYVVAMLALARIGAVHSVVYTGFSMQGLRQRLFDCRA